MKSTKLFLGFTLIFCLASFGCAKGLKAIEVAANDKCNAVYQYELDRSACYVGVSNFLEPEQLKSLFSKVSYQKFNGNGYYVVRFQDWYNYSKERANTCDISFKDKIDALSACQKGIEVTASILLQTVDNRTTTFWDKDGSRLLALDSGYAKNMKSGLTNQNMVQPDAGVIEQELERQPGSK